ncbi:MAG: hypothetical protein AAGI49_11140 [Bacteroidota bacterium]
MKPIVFAIYIMALCLGHQASAQIATTQYMDSLKTDVVYLKDGSIFRGSILKYYPNATLKMELLSGAKVRFDAKNILRIEQGIAALEKVAQQPKPSKVKAFKDEGFEHMAALSFLNGTTPWNSDYILGLGLNYVVSYKFNPKYSLGIGSGVDYYYLAQREMVVPIFVAAKRSFPWKNSLQPFLTLSGGYGIGIKSEAQNVSDAEGGWMLHPAVGLEFGSSKDYHWQLDLGVRMQSANFTFDSPWNARETTMHEMTFKRFAVRLGFVF